MPISVISMTNRPKKIKKSKKNFLARQIPCFHPSIYYYLQHQDNVDSDLFIQAFNVHVQAFRYLLSTQCSVDGVAWRTLDGPLSSWHLVIKIVYSQLGNIWCELHPLNATMKSNNRSQHLLCIFKVNHISWHC